MCLARKPMLNADNPNDPATLHNVAFEPAAPITLCLKRVHLASGWSWPSNVLAVHHDYELSTALSYT